MKISTFKRISSAIQSLTMSTKKTVVGHAYAACFKGMCSPYKGRHEVDFNDPWSPEGPRFSPGEILVSNDNFVLGLLPFGAESPSEIMKEYVRQQADILDFGAPDGVHFIYKVEREDIPLEEAKGLIEFLGGYFSVAVLYERELVTVLLPSRVYHGTH